MTFTKDYIDLGGTVYFFDRVNALPNDKEHALKKSIVMVCRSWTFDRMTHKEKERCIDSMLWASSQGIVIGSFRQRWMILQAIYSAYLDGLGYDGPSWREAV